MRYDGDLQPLIDWVRRTPFDPTNTARDRKDVPPPAFMEFVRRVLPTEGYYHYWAATITEETASVEPGWVQGFPHVHAWNAATLTMICFLTSCEGGENVVGQGQLMSNPIETKPAPGVCVQVDGDTWHGVRPVTAGERLALIVTSFPKSQA